MNSNIFRLQIYNLRTFSLSACKFKNTNHYDCLGITPKATQGDVKTAYYKLSKEYHPDVNRDNATAAEKFRDITAAYEVLGNLKSRKLYDRRLLVGTHEEIYPSEDKVDLNIKHASFHKQRNKPMRKNTTDQFTKYDIDEWTKAHYSSTFSSAFKYKVEEKENLERNETSLREHRSVLEITFFACSLLALFGLVFGFIGSGFDRPVISDSGNKSDKA